MARIAGIAMLLATAIGSSPARAEPVRPWRAELTVGGSINITRGQTVGELRLFTGYVRRFASVGKNWALYGVFGARASTGSINPDADNVPSATRRALGLEARVAMATESPKKRYQAEFYLSASPVYAWTIPSDAQGPAEAGGAYGVRFAVGLTIPGSHPYTWRELSKGCSNDCDLFALLITAIFPNTFEIGYLRLAGDTGTDQRLGILAGYAF